MSTRQSLRTTIEYRLSDLGTNYESHINTAINWAIEEIGLVNWKFLYKELDLVLEAGDTELDLWDNTVSDYCDFGRVYKVYLESDGNNYELKRGTPEDISLVILLLDTSNPLIPPTRCIGYHTESVISLFRQDRLFISLTKTAAPDIALK